MDFKAPLVSSNNEICNATKYCILPFDLHHYCLHISPSLLTDMFLGLSLPPSALLNGA